MSKAHQEALQQLLEHGGEYPLSDGLEPLKAVADEAGWAFCIADCEKARSWSAVFRSTVKAVDFPEFFSNGFDGLYDCLCDTLLDQKSGLCLVFDKLHSADPAIAQEDRHFKQVLLDTVDFANENSRAFVYAIHHVGKHPEAVPGVVHSWSDEPG